MQASSLAHKPAETLLSGSRPLRVVMLGYRDNLNVGGSLRVMETLANAFDPQLVQSHMLFAYGEPGPISIRSSVPCHFLRAKGPSDLAGWRRARRLISELKPDLIHFHAPVAWMHLALAGMRVRKVQHFHGPFPLQEMKLSHIWLPRVLARRFVGSISINGSIRDVVLQQRWCSRKRSFVVHNGINCAAFESLPSRQEARALLGIPKDRRVAGVVCRLAQYKGCDDAIPLLQRLGPDWMVMFCGDGPMRPELVSMARSAGVLDRFIFTGMLDDVRPAYAAMDAYLFLSKDEPFGLVLAEAMAARVPVFGLAGKGGYRDPEYPLITSQTARLLERSDSQGTAPGCSKTDNHSLDELEFSLRSFAASPEKARTMVDKAHHWVNAKFDQSVQAAGVLNVYVQLLTGDAS
jgi:glycosyltransferase involved in cell wall biosynthesis